jgi:hypothetical protein
MSNFKGYNYKPEILKNAASALDMRALSIGSKFAPKDF